jgi:hypothetical protein
MDGSWSTHWGRRDAYTVWVGKPEENKPLGRPGIYGKIILKRIVSKWVGCMDGIDVAQERDKWWILANALMNFRVT